MRRGFDRLGLEKTGMNVGLSFGDVLGGLPRFFGGIVCRCMS
jgi:hypothetical protein